MKEVDINQLYQFGIQPQVPVKYEFSNFWYY